MKVTTERLENCIVALDIQVDDRETHTYLRSSARTLAREYRIPGFRPGKAPYNVVVQRFGIEAIQKQVLDQFGDKLEENLKEMTSALNYRLGAVATEMANTAESLNGSIGQFDTSIQTFANNTRDFSEFNHDLRSNIQRMNILTNLLKSCHSDKFAAPSGGPALNQQ